MEVLTAYVRQHAPRRPEQAQQVEHDATPVNMSEENSRGEERLEDILAQIAEVPAPAADIQAIMTVIRRRTRSFNRGEPERLDLRATNLTGANLRGANLTTRAILAGANLTGAYYLTHEQLEATT
jgi:uncharacterized protein YjbI with pentapeptide repeats